MKTIGLGRMDLKVARVGIGGIPFTRLPMDEAVKAIQRALDLEVNSIDTRLLVAKTTKSDSASRFLHAENT